MAQSSRKVRKLGMRTLEENRFTYLSADGKTDISAKSWTDEKLEPRAILQIAHGMTEHKERYNAFARWLAKHGILVCANDHLGHGNSITDESSFGYMTDKNPSDVLITDMHTLREMMQEEYPDLPYFMAGHSMGSYMLRKYLAIHGEGLAGAIIMGTGHRDEGTAKVGVFITEALARIKGWKFRSRAVQNLTYDKNYRKFDLQKKDKSNSWLSRNEDEVEKYFNDPKSGFLFTLSGHKALFEAVAFDANEDNNRKIPQHLPMLMISGAEDPVGGMGKGVKAAFDLLKKTGHDNVKMKLYPGARHELLNEIEETKTEVYEDILNWIMSNLRS